MKSQRHYCAEMITQHKLGPKSHKKASRQKGTESTIISTTLRRLIRIEPGCYDVTVPSSGSGKRSRREENIILSRYPLVSVVNILPPTLLSMGPFGVWFDGACWLLMGSIDLYRLTFIKRIRGQQRQDSLRSSGGKPDWYRWSCGVRGLPECGIQCSRLRQRKASPDECFSNQKSTFVRLRVSVFDFV